MRRGPQRDDRRFEIRAPFLWDSLDDDEHVEHPIIEQRRALLGSAALPNLPDVSRLVNNRRQSLPRVFVRMSESLGLAHGSLRLQRAGRAPLTARRAVGVWRKWGNHALPRSLLTCPIRAS